VSRGQRNGSPRPLVSVFYTGAAISNFADKRRSLGRYSSLADYRPRSLFIFVLLFLTMLFLLLFVCFSVSFFLSANLYGVGR
jgi:hypothetical protein